MAFKKTIWFFAIVSVAIWLPTVQMDLAVILTVLVVMSAAAFINIGIIGNIEKAIKYQKLQYAKNLLL